MEIFMGLSHVTFFVVVAILRTPAATAAHRAAVQINEK